MTVYEKIGLDYILENLNLLTVLGKKRIKNLKLMTSISEIENEFQNMEMVEEILEKNRNLRKDLNRQLADLRDITITVERLKEGYILDDIELFEIKDFSMVSQEIYKLIGEMLPKISLPDLEKVVDILDPDRMRIKSFHIYSSYSPELSAIRIDLKKDRDEALYEREMAVEDRIRQEITKKLRIYMGSLKKSIGSLGYLDVLLAKVKQKDELGLKRPEIGEITQYHGLFNPKVSELLEKKSKIYQKIDMGIGKGVTVITGANMSGKTLTLKSLALCQYLCQMGFFLPIDSGQVKIVDDIYLSVGDSQSVESGLSSYAAEMLELNRIIKAVKEGIRPLILIDELARTTNPQEGRAIVSGVIEILEEAEVSSVITTHYDGIGKNIKRLRVKGLKYHDIPYDVTDKNIEDYMDYSLMEDEEGKVPEEALSVAKLLKVDEDIINRAYMYLKGGNSNV